MSQSKVNANLKTNFSTFTLQAFLLLRFETCRYVKIHKRKRWVAILRLGNLDLTNRERESNSVTELGKKAAKLQYLNLY